MSDYSQCLEEYGSIKRTPSVHSIDSIHMQRNNHRSTDISMQLHKNGNLFIQSTIKMMLRCPATATTIKCGTKTSKTLCHIYYRS